MVFRLETEPVQVVASRRPFVKALFHPEGIKDGYCINGYHRENAGTKRVRAFSTASSNSLLLWNVGGASRLPEWEPGSPYCRYDSDINSFATHPAFSPRRDEFRTLYWTYASESQNLASMEVGLQSAGYAKSQSGWWQNAEGPWILVSDDQMWLTTYSVSIVDSSQPFLPWTVAQPVDTSITDQLDETRSIFASQPDALRLFEQAVESWSESVQPVTSVTPLFVNPWWPFYWTTWPLPAFSYGTLHPWQQAFLEALASQTVETQP